SFFGFEAFLGFLPGFLKRPVKSIPAGSLYIGSSGPKDIELGINFFNFCCVRFIFYEISCLSEVFFVLFVDFLDGPVKSIPAGSLYIGSSGPKYVLFLNSFFNFFVVGFMMYLPFLLWLTHQVGL
ncbi:MAG: hypothetical protein QF447_07845, partial [Candidatus Thioglobus sp.]|nr:hypothetical protein [Candidatus Thioglobus sp.]